MSRCEMETVREWERVVMSKIDANSTRTQDKFTAQQIKRNIQNQEYAWDGKNQGVREGRDEQDRRQ